MKNKFLTIATALIASFAFITIAQAYIFNPGGGSGGGAVSSLTTIGTSGSSTLSGGVLNIPVYSSGGGGTGTSTRYLTLPTASCINANASPLFSVADANAPLPGCIGVNQGFEQFVAVPGTEQFLYGQTWIPADFSGIKFAFKFRSASATGTVAWKVATACVPDGTSAASTTFGTPAVVATTVPTTTLNVITTSYITPTVGTCVTSSLLLYEISRSATDTATNTADLLSVSPAISGSL